MHHSMTRESPALNEYRLVAILNQKKAKTIQIFKPGQLELDAVALPLAPPPQPNAQYPCLLWCYTG